MELTVPYKPNPTFIFFSSTHTQLSNSHSFQAS
ncbi:hypothetical protein CFP56_036558 [Quercus suber]|uniref:Uncharacterized protein n=1 Tax=Quercus suber TaxID=58331 RepID=A0AAW0J759_QUESU